MRQMGLGLPELCKELLIGLNKGSKWFSWQIFAKKKTSRAIGQCNAVSVTAAIPSIRSGNRSLITLINKSWKMLRLINQRGSAPALFVARWSAALTALAISYRLSLEHLARQELTPTISLPP